MDLKHSNSDRPPVKGFSEIPQDQQKRYEDLISVFKQKYGKSPEFFAQAPGRVNLIGEHIDYCGYSVLPMAVEQNIIIAAAPSDDDKILLANKDPKFTDFQCSTSNLTIAEGSSSWHVYFLCGLKGIVDSGLLQNQMTGLYCMVDGVIPKSAGLSSSSALVCCSALVAAFANNLKFSKSELSELCTVSERYCGTQGGGMDQSIAFMAEEGQAKLISFNPLSATNVHLPSGVVFVVSNSCVEMHKAATSNFNIRVVECQLATQVLAKKLDQDYLHLKKLGDLQKCLGYDLPKMVSTVKELLHPEAYSKEEVCTILEIEETEFNKTRLCGNTQDVKHFQLYNRALHVFSEANRVYQFQNICDHPDAESIPKLAQLMNASHNSCRDLYDCSCPQLDTLVNICLQSGAVASRLTGAGWGGCAVSMVPTEQLNTFMEKVKTEYFLSKPELAIKVTESLFASKPGNGAAIIVMKLE
ncbi:N-acetylgalactosamine kinase-like isoform X1 [Argonauta hians]